LLENVEYTSPQNPISQPTHESGSVGHTAKKPKKYQLQNKNTEIKTGIAGLDCKTSTEKKEELFSKIV